MRSSKPPTATAGISRGRMAWGCPRAAAEAEVERQGHEIRKVEGVRCVRGGQRGEADFTPYTSHSDSLLLRRDSPSADPQVQRQIQHQTAMDLSDDIGSVTELEEFLEGSRPNRERHPHLAS